MEICKNCGGIEDWYDRVYFKITYECAVCGYQELDEDQEYYQNYYPNDKYRKPSELYPDPDWTCPNHYPHPGNNIGVTLLLEEIRSEPRTDDTEPYEREDDPEILENIEMEGEMCTCGHIWDTHYPPWSPDTHKGKCRLDICSCGHFELLEEESENKRTK